MGSEDIERDVRLKSAIEDAAFGKEYRVMRMVERELPNGDKVSDKIIEQKAVPPNVALLEKIMDSQIGGEEDWC